MKSLKFTGSLHPDNDTLTDMMKILILAMIILKCTIFRFSCYNSCHMGLENHVTQRDLRLTEGEVNLAPVCPVAQEMPL